VALAEIGHFAGIELDIGTADANALGVDNDLAGGGERRLDIIDTSIVRPVKNQCAHAVSIPPRPTKAAVAWCRLEALGYLVDLVSNQAMCFAMDL